MTIPDSAGRPGAVVLASIGYYIVAMIVLHLLEPALNPLERPMSGYLRSPHAFLATTTFFALAIAIAALNLGLQRTLRSSRTTAVIVGLLWVAVAGIVIAGLFPGPPMHIVGGAMTFPPLLVGLASASLVLPRTPHWRDLRTPLLTLAAIAVALFLAGVTVLSNRGLAGLGQRLFFVALFGWMAVIAWRMARSSARTS